jgi:hypothetical protein
MILEVRILNELWVRFAEVRIVKGLGDCGRLFGWIVVSAFGDKALTQRTRRAQSSQRRNREAVGWQGIGVRDCGRICWRVVRTRECVPVSPPLRKQDQYTRKRNEINRMIVPNGYLNEVLLPQGLKPKTLGALAARLKSCPPEAWFIR